MTDQNPRAVIGDNRPPPFDPEVVKAFTDRVSDFNDAAGEVWEAGQIKSGDEAARVNDLLAGARLLYKEIDERRKADKAPWVELGKQVDTAFNGLLKRLEELTKRPKQMQADWLRREEQRLNAEREAERKRLEEERAKIAQDAANAQARYDAASNADAVERLKEIEKEEKRLSQPVRATAESATGGARRQGLRRRKVGRIVSYAKVLTYYREDALVREAVQKCIDRDVRARDVDETKIPGIEIDEVEAVT